MDPRSDPGSARALLLARSPSRALGLAVLLSVGLYAAGAVLCFAGWVRHPGGMLWLAGGLLLFAAALGLWRMLAWARLLTVLALWSVMALTAVVLLTGGAARFGSPPPALVAAGLGLIGVAAWAVRVLGRHKGRFCQRLL